MHFPIIKLESIDTPVQHWSKNLNEEDTVIQCHTDYIGPIYSLEERREVIESKWLKDLFKGVAKFDSVTEVITFLNPDEIETTISNYLIHLTSALHVDALKKKLRWFDLYRAAEVYKECDVLFYIDHAYTSFDFIDEARYLAGKTYMIGNIFDAHI